MSQNNNTTKREKFQHLNLEERKILQRLLHKGVSQADISRVLYRHKSTISREVARGSVIQKKKINSNCKRIDIPLEETYKKYFFDVGDRNYKKNRHNCGAKCKILENMELIEFVEKMIFSSKKWSPDAAIGHANVEKMFKNTISTKTFYNWIDAGLVKVKNIDLLLKVKRKIRSKIKTRKKILGKSIEERPKDIETREEFGHWEGDGIIGKNHKGHIITLVERKSGVGLIFNVFDRQDDKIVNVLDLLERKYGKHFSKIFKSITFDNGTEFSNSTGMENNNRTDVYYAHPSSPWERGINENWNGIVRRFIPKGTSFETLSFEKLERINMWINTMPRKRFGYKTPHDLFNKEINDIIA